MRLLRFCAPLLLLCTLLASIGNASAAAAGKNQEIFTAKNGVWLHKGKPFYSTSAHVIFHTFRKDRETAIKDLKELKKAGFTVVEVYWQWQKDLDPNTLTYSFDVFDDFVLECKKVGIKTFCMFQQYAPDCLGNKYGWDHTSEEGKRDFRCDDFYVCDPTFVQEAKRYYTTLVKHLKERPEVSENVLYWNMGGEYKPFRPHRQPKPLDYGYDKHTLAAFRKWLQAKSLTPDKIAKRWGFAGGTYSSWDDVWPAVNMKDTDYQGRALSKIGAARWDWYDFRQEVSSKFFSDAIRWVREAGDNRPMVHEYNIITPGGLAQMLRWSRVGARSDKDGIFQASGTFDREFDYQSLLYNLAICKGASDAPWQSNEQKGNTPSEWMQKHAWLLIGWGGTGMVFWDWAGEGWGVVNPDRSKGESYAQAVRLNAQYAFYGDLLAGSKPVPNRIGILALSEESFYSPLMHDRERGFVLKALLEHGSGPEVAIITDDEVLEDRISDYKVIIVPGQVHMRQSVRVKLTEFVKNGGTLWLTSGSASKDETDEVTSVNPGAPLDQVAGVKVTGDMDPVIAKLSDGNYILPLSPLGMLDKSVVSTTAEAIAYVKDKPAIFKNAYGKGICYYAAAGTAYPPGEDTPLSRDPEGLKYYMKSNAGQPWLDLLCRVLDEQGIGAYATAFGVESDSFKSKKGSLEAIDHYDVDYEKILTGVRKTDSGYLLFLVESENRKIDHGRVYLNAKRLGLKGKWAAYSPLTLEHHDLSSMLPWEVLKAGVTPSSSSKTNSSLLFAPTLDPSEVKIFHIVPEKDCGKWIAHFKQKNWQSVAAKLPPLPEKTLLPPLEIGKIDPGDLKSVKPKPHGDKWLLVDLSRHANRSLADEGKQENAKAFLGSVGTGDNDLQELPKGLQEFVGIPFDILDPAVSKNSCLITKTNGRPWLGPLEFKDIPVRDKVKKVHWLYGTGWAPFDLPVGYITYRYSDGTKDQENLICGKNIMNWWGRAEKYESEKLQLAWGGSTPSAARNYTTVGLYHYAWENPHPEKPVESIDVTSYGGDACIITVAITAEK